MTRLVVTRLVATVVVTIGPGRIIRRIRTLGMRIVRSLDRACHADVARTGQSFGAVIVPSQVICHLGNARVKAGPGRVAERPSRS
ncbi:hypothetical protein [Rhodoplanes sp. SY1]|uniref:hypothetical protein n=1 Tax=Rhodoplanes sp. SY1 TaxID=3166646 RepID=UPI0038B45178